jgi:ribosomal protein S18 acetylase RimI-like enzyme
MAAIPEVTTLSGCDAAEILGNLGALGELLHACVHDGASIGYVLPFSVSEAEGFWRDKVLPAVASGSRLVLVARQGARLAGTVQLDWDTPPNQPHRAEVRKLLVHPDFRRLGIGRALMAEVERRALVLGRRLLTLDTRTGDAAEPLYLALGYAISGTIPSYCRDPFVDKFDATTVMYKAL